jgi:hypothetical protein
MVIAPFLLKVKIVLTSVQAARSKQGNDLIVHSERFFSAHPMSR